MSATIASATFFSSGSDCVAPKAAANALLLPSTPIPTSMGASACAGAAPVVEVPPSVVPVPDPAAGPPGVVAPGGTAPTDGAVLGTEPRPSTGLPAPEGPLPDW